MITISFRVLLIAAATTLAGCAGENNAADLAPAAPQQAEAPPPEPAPAAPKRGAPAGRNMQGAPAPAAPPPAQKVASTPEEIKAQCWMKYEDDKKIKNLDQRAALVDKCITDASRNQPPPPRQ
jgi:hypothetical protein